MSRLIPCLAIVFTVVFGPSRVSAAPITLTLNGTINFVGLPIQIPLVATDDPFSVELTYDPASPLTGPAPTVDTYEGAVGSFQVVVHTSHGEVRYSASGGASPTTVNFAALRGSDLFFQITDADENGATGSVQGPGFIASGITYAPNFLALEIGAPFSAALDRDLLPTDPFSQFTYIQLTIGYWGRIRPNLIQQVVTSGAAVPTPVPEPTAALLVGGGLLAFVAARGRSARK